MNLQARQDAAASGLVDALAGLMREGELTLEARTALMRVCSGHERRTVALLTLAAAAVRRCRPEPPPAQARVREGWLRWLGRRRHERGDMATA